MNLPCSDYILKANSLLKEENSRFEECLSKSQNKEEIDADIDPNGIKDPKKLILLEFNEVIIKQYIQVFKNHPQGFISYLKTNNLEVKTLY